MNTSGKLFWGMFAAELLVAGYIGWQIAHARYHPWEVQPGKQRNPAGPDPIRGMRQRPGALPSLRNALAGTIETRKL